MAMGIWHPIVVFSKPHRRQIRADHRNGKKEVSRRKQRKKLETDQQAPLALVPSRPRGGGKATIGYRPSLANRTSPCDDCPHEDHLLPRIPLRLLASTITAIAGKVEASCFLFDTRWIPCVFAVVDCYHVIAISFYCPTLSHSFITDSARWPKL